MSSIAPDRSDAELQWIENLNGESQPWRVAAIGDDDAEGLPRHYVLKNFRVGDDHRRYVEYVATRVAHEFHIGAPRAAILRVTPQFLEALHYISPRPQILDLALPGPQMGILWYNNAEPVRALKFGKIHEVKSPEQAAGIVAVDTLLQNPDRHAGNLLLRRVSGNELRRLFVPIDWGGALDHAPLEDAALAAIVRRRYLYPGSAGLLQNVPADAFLPFRAAVDAFLRRPSLLQSIVEWVPEEWRVPDVWKKRLHQHLRTRAEILLETLLHLDERTTKFEGQLYLKPQDDAVNE